MDKRAWSIIVLCITLVSSGCVCSGISGGGGGGGEGQPTVIPPMGGLAALNPELLQYEQDLKAGKIVEKTEDGYYLGYVPTVVDLAHLTGQQLNYDEAPVEPDNSGNSKRAVLHQVVDSYDLRQKNKLTTIKNQGSIGSCWAFATYGSLESYLLPAEIRNFSENNMKNTLGFDRAHSDGGNHLMSAAYLTRWIGPINEADDPYNTYSGMSRPNLAIQKHVQDVLFIPDRANSSDNENIKQAIKKYGAAYTTLYYYPYANSPYYNTTNHSYYFNNTGGYANHAVDVVGWDDSYNKSRFPIAPPGDGAFIVRNSWGTDWGESGYFYVSYYDMWFGKHNAVFTAVPTSNYDHIYQCDPLGLINCYGNGETAWFANIFNATANEQLVAVSFYAMAPNTEYNIYIYKDPTSSPMVPNGLVTGVSGILNVPGYRTVTIPAVSLSKGHKYSIVVKARTPGFRTPVAIEFPQSEYNVSYSGLSSKAKSNASESYYSANGGTWTDMATLVPNANVCLKAFARAGGTGVPDAQVVSSTIPAIMASGQRYNVSITMKNTGNVSWIGNYRLTGFADASRFGPAGMLLSPLIVVDPGQTYTWNLTLTAPGNGTYGLSYRMADDAGSAFGAAANKSVLVEAPVYDAAVITSSIPSMIVGQTYSVSVTMKNTGNMPWSAGDNVMLGAVENATNDAIKFSGSRISLPSGVTVQPGEQYKFSFTMKAPGQVGSYIVKYRMVKDAAWFGDTLSKTILVKTSTYK